MTRNHARVLIGLVAGTALLTGLVGAPAVANATPAPQLTNLDHLDFLTADVPLLPGVTNHTTYDMQHAPEAEALWAYANIQPDGSYQRVGGGAITDAAKGYYAQGAFDADDIARAAVVYLRDWKQHHTASSEQHAYQLLRELTYLQDSSGPNAGEVVLWQQSDGTLNPSPTPADAPNPSDSAESYWTARTMWALGEGYADFAHTNPSFASFLQNRMDLALHALGGQSLARVGSYVAVNGSKVPDWLITASAGATAEAVLGLSAYVQAAPNDRTARDALSSYATGIADQASGGIGQWPFGAILPEANSRSYWHAWSGLAPAALAVAAQTLRRQDLLRTADTALAQFTAQLLASGGPDNGLEPTPADTTQIAYGTDSLVESLIDAADATHDAGLDTLAGVAAGWYFGANPANQPVYDPSTGDCVDGIQPDASVNRNCGAESDIHTELSMLALDAHPQIAALATSLTAKTAVHGMQTVEAESGTLTGNAAVVTPTAQWTGSASFSGDAYVDAKAGSTITITLPTGVGAANIYPVVNRQQGALGSTTWTASGSGRRSISLGSTANGNVGAQGIAPTPTELVPLSLGRTAPAGTTTITARVTGGDAQIDAVIVQPVVSSVTMRSGSGTLALFVNGGRAATVGSTSAAGAPAGGSYRSYSSTGALVRAGAVRGGRVPVASGGFTAVLSR